MNQDEWSLDEKQTVGGRDAAAEPTRMYSRRVCVRPDSWIRAWCRVLIRGTHNRDRAFFILGCRARRRSQGLP